MTAFETIGRSEKALIAKLLHALDKIQSLITPIPGFADIAAYTAVETSLFKMICEGNIDQTRLIVTQHGIRRLPMGISMNHESNIEDLRLIGPHFNWSPVIHLINNALVSEQFKIDMIRYLLETGFHVSNVFAHTP